MAFEHRLPLRWQESWDASGLQVGDPAWKVTRVLVALDACLEVVRYAVEHKCDLILVHHPLFFRPLPDFDLRRYEAKVAALALEHKISIYAAHTNHDRSRDGLSYRYAWTMGLTNLKPLIPPLQSERGLWGMGAIGKAPELLKLADWVACVQTLWQVKTVRWVGDPGAVVRRVGLCTGSGSSLIPQALELECDLFITGDIKYHTAVDARRAGLCLIDPGHYASEVANIDALAGLVRAMPGFRGKIEVYRALQDVICTAHLGA
jgi:dinuclear metal center YbgI/SA1388 family protein